MPRRFAPVRLEPGRRAGLFGGSFNPPHVAHLAVAQACADQLGLDRVVWMPAATPPHKPSGPDLATPADRIAMVRLATAGNPRFAVSTHEIDRAGVSYTVDTLHALHAAHPDTTWTLLLGGDSLAAFSTWREPEEIAALADLAVYARPGSDPTDERAAVIEAPALDLSSTQVRGMVRAGRSIRYLVPDAVAVYIADHGLYAR